MIQLVLRPAGALEVLGLDGRLLFALAVHRPARGNVRRLHERAGEPLPPGHYRVVDWSRGDAAAPARLNLADLDRSAEARLVDAGRASRGPDAGLLDVGGIRARTGGLGGLSGPAIHAVGDGSAPAGGIALDGADLLRLVDLLESDPSHGVVVLTVVGGPYQLN